MANAWRWRGDAAAVAGVQTVTITGTPTTGKVTTFIFPNGKSLSYTALSTDTSATILANSIQAVLAASTAPAEFAEITWAAANGVITATAATPGVPFSFAVVTTDTALTITQATTVANSGPNDVSLPANWWLGVSPPVVNQPTQSASGGSFGASTQYWVITAQFVGENGTTSETPASKEVTTTFASGATNEAILTWLQVQGATGYKIYRSATSGTYGASSLVTTIASGSTLTYTDTGSATSSGSPPANLPGANDDVYFEVPVAAKWNLQQFNGVAFNSLNVSNAFAGSPGTGGFGGNQAQAALGLPAYNPNGYLEYRQTYFQCAPANVAIGYGAGQGPQLVKLDTGTANVNLVILNTGSPLEANSEAVRWKGVNTGTTIEIVRGTLGVARLAGETATLNILDIGYVSNVGGDATVVVGTGVTLGGTNPAVQKSGGILKILGAAATIPTINQTGGTTEILGTGVNVTTATVDAGILYYSSTGTIATLNIGNSGEANFTRDLRGRTVTNCNVYAGARLIDSFATVTFTNPVQSVRCRNRDLQSQGSVQGGSEFVMDVGENRKYAIST